MTPRLEPAGSPTIYFVGVSTGRSSIMQVFPAWAEYLGLQATIRGVDLPLDDEPTHYRSVVEFIKHDPQSLGALVTTHKLNLYKASRDLFDRVGDDARMLDEISSISKCDGELWGHAMDPLTSGLALQAITGAGYWARTGGELLLLGAGGSTLALTLHVHREQLAGRDRPSHIVVTSRGARRLEEMRAVHKRIGFAVPVTYIEAPDSSANDQRLALLQAGSVVVNGTGLGKDLPGSPLTGLARFPAHGIAWDFNYRGDLAFLAQAQAQQSELDLHVVDGWTYFVHGWTRVIAEVFNIEIPTAGQRFDELSKIALAVGGSSARHNDPGIQTPHPHLDRAKRRDTLAALSGPAKGSE